MKKLMERLQALIGQMESKNAEIMDLAGKVQTEADANKKSAFTTVLASKREEFTGLTAQVAEVRAQIDAQKAIEDAKALVEPDAVGKSLTNPKKETSVETVSDPLKDEMAKREIFLGYIRGGAKALDGRAFEAISAKSKIGGANIVNPVMLPAHMAADILNPHPKCGKAVFDGGVLGQARESMAGKVILSTDATGGATDSNANKLVPPDFRQELLKEPVFMPQLYDLCRIIPAAYGKATWPMLDQGQGDFGGVAFTWKATEGADKGETEPVFKDFEITTHELSGWTEMSITALSRSAIGLEAELTTLFRDACRYEFSKMVLGGSGVNQPLGILHATAAITAVNRQVANEVEWKDYVNLEFAIKQGYRSGARFIEDDTVEKFTKSATDGMNRPLYTIDVTTGLRTTLAGYPYLTHSYTPQLGTAGDVAFGNFRYYGWAVESDIAIARSDEAEFKKGRVVFRLITFVGGKPIFTNAFAKLAATAEPEA